MTGPLHDVRVVALEQYGAGPFGTMQLADLGADVIRVEDPLAADVGREVPPFAMGGTSLFFESFNRNKRAVAVDIRTPDGRQVLEDLVRAADALVSNLRGDQPQKLRIRYDDLAHLNPRLVCVALSAFGGTGPRARQGGYDFTIQGLAGWMALTGGPDQPPTKSGLSLVDFCAGYVAALAVVAGVSEARQSGRGCDADISLFETALAQLTYVGTWVATEGYVPPRLSDSAHPSMVPFQTFSTADGRLVVACPKDSLWSRLCDALDRPDLAADDRCATVAGRSEHRQPLIDELARVLSERPTASWVALLEERGIPCAAVSDVASAFRDKQTIARGAVVEYPHPVFGVVRTTRSPLRLSSIPQPRLEPAPLLGEHTREVLAEVCGYDSARIDALFASGVVSAPVPGEVR
jgi:crotonobetainyl-CoA:carnitine CoA-transferase CaiB-like acyl-CoA transferase